MKHIKTFENNSENYWLFVYDIKDGDTSYSLYPDQETCENNIIDIINEERENYEIDNEVEYTEDMIFTEIDEALEWFEDNFKGVTITYHSLHLSPRYSGSEKIKKLRTTRNYNL